MVAQDLTRGSKSWYNYYNGGVLLKKNKSCYAAPFFATRGTAPAPSEHLFAGAPPSSAERFDWGCSSSSSFQGARNRGHSSLGNWLGGTQKICQKKYACMRTKFLVKIFQKQLTSTCILWYNIYIMGEFFYKKKQVLKKDAYSASSVPSAVASASGSLSNSALPSSVKVY